MKVGARRSAGLAVLALAAALAGCQSYEVPSVPRPASIPARFVTQLAGPETYLAPMPTAVVILTPDDMGRNCAFCTAFMRLPTAGEALSQSAVAPNLILTRWLTQMRDVPPSRAADCDYLVSTYDYGRAARLMAAFRASVRSVVGPGPYLALVVPDARGLRIVAVDGSRYAAGDLDRFVADWGQAVNQIQMRLSAQPDQPPGLTRSVFDLVSAVLRTVIGATAGLITGTLDGA